MALDFKLTEEVRKGYWERFVAIPTNDPINRDLMARELFETTFRIHDHDTVLGDNPFPLATYHKKRPKNWPLYDAVSKLISKRVPEKTNMTVKELLYDTDMELYSTINEVMKEQNDLEGTAIDNISNEANKNLMAALDAMNKK